MTRALAIEKMNEILANHYQCSENDIDLSALDLGTTWHEGQDFEADYEVSVSDQIFEGRVYWSFVSQEAYL